jgi:hypothetical protein
MNTHTHSLSRVRPNSEYGTGKMRGDGSVWGYESVPVSHLDCAVVSLFCFLDSLFPFFIAFLLFSFLFCDLPHHGIGMGRQRGG